MDYRRWHWIAERYDDSGMPLVAKPAPPRNWDDFERCLSRAAFSYCLASLRSGLHRYFDQIGMSRGLTPVQEVHSNPELNLDRTDALHETKVA